MTSHIQLQPFVNFQGRAREALEYYHKVLGGRLDLQGMRLEVDGSALHGTDGHPDYPPTVGNQMAIALSAGDKARAATIFSALAEGGRVQMPFSGEAGWVVDRFGVTWMVGG